MVKRSVLSSVAAAAAALLVDPSMGANEVTATTKMHHSSWQSASFQCSVPRGGAEEKKEAVGSSKKFKKKKRRRAKSAKNKDKSSPTEQSADGDSSLSAPEEPKGQPEKGASEQTADAKLPTEADATSADQADDLEDSTPTAAEPKERPEPTKPTETARETEPKSSDEPAFSQQQSASNKESATASSSSSSSTGPPPVVQEILRESDYYKILGLNPVQHKTAPVSVITKAYRRRAVLVHPDKLGTNDRSAFDKVSQAYDVLSDETKRQIYNRHGKRGLEDLQQGGGAAGSPEDLFRSFFFGGGRPPQAAPRRNRTMRYQLEVTLEDLYEGMTRTVLVSPPERMVSKNKRVTVQVPRGALDGQSVTLSGQVDFDETETPGDLIFVLHQRPHGMFTRKGYDLAVSVPIRLQEAVTGVQRRLRHLNGKEITLTSPGATWDDTSTTAGVIQNGQVQVLKGYGMPKDNQGKEFGDLYVQYRVEMPLPKPGAPMTPEERIELHRLLDKLEGRQTVELPERKENDDSVLVLEPAVLSDFGHASGTPQVVDPPDEDEQEGFRPFGRRGFAFSSHHGFGGGPSHPFFGMPQNMYQDDGADEDHAQCRQM